MKIDHKRPLIVTPYSPIPGVPVRFAVNEAYARAIGGANGNMFMLAVAQSKTSVREMIDIADGLLLTGGGDVSPRLYHESKEPYTVNVNSRRDWLERVALERAFKRKMPILAICRGMQMLNVFLGGTLWQDLSKERKPARSSVGGIDHDNHDNPNRGFLSHEVEFQPGTRLCKILGESKLMVNSMHHQGVRKLGDGLIASAYSADGLVEALELRGHPFFCIAVQWHPEELIHDDVWQELFNFFVGEALRYSGRSKNN